MGVSRVDYGGRTLIDLTSDTITPSRVLSGYTAHDKAGNAITGSAKRGHNYFDAIDFTPPSNVTSYTVPYDNTKNVVFVACYDTVRDSSPGNYSIGAIFFYNFFIATGNAKLGSVFDYQGTERSNVSYGACTIDTTNGVITVAGQSASYLFKANRTYRIIIIYDVVDAYRLILNMLGGTYPEDFDPLNPSPSVPAGEPYENEIKVVNEHFTLGSVSILMGGVDITATAYDANTHKINVPSVTADLTINANGTNDYFLALCDTIYVEQYNSGAPAIFNQYVGNSGGVYATAINSGIRLFIPLKSVVTNPGFNIYLKCDDVLVEGSNNCWSLQCYAYNANQQQLSGNVDFITTSTSVTDVLGVINGIRGWFPSNWNGAAYLMLQIRTNNNFTQQSGVVFQNLRVQLTQDD